MGRARVRRLTVDGQVWLWNVGHTHPDCRTYLTLRRVEARHSALRLVFRDGPGRIVAGFPMGAGEVAAVDGGHLNLHEPGVVRRFLDLAAARGLLPVAHGAREVDGWPLFDALTGAGRG
ncbi:MULTISPECIES: hypothetical protein [unclassified Streptomyces]|jgi:hypothetical protein|uniref:hypothetical protein n=1 Tax=unclassified Streptomyces TaxID=2593676 RepID=UPI0036B16C3A